MKRIIFSPVLVTVGQLWCSVSQEPWFLATTPFPQEWEMWSTLATLYQALRIHTSYGNVKHGCTLASILLSHLPWSSLFEEQHCSMCSVFLFRHLLHPPFPSLTPATFSHVLCSTMPLVFCSKSYWSGWDPVTCLESGTVLPQWCWQAQ